MGTHHDGVNCADSGARQHGDDQLEHHGHVDGHAVSLCHPLGFENVGALAHLLQQLFVCDPRVVLGVIALPRNSKYIWFVKLLIQKID